ELGALESVVLRCLEKRPERRYVDMTELGAELARIARFGDDGGVSVEPANAPRSQPPRLADELELPSNTEPELPRAGIPGRGLPGRGGGGRGGRTVVGAVAPPVVWALGVGVGMIRASSRPGAGSVEPAPSHAALPPAPAVSEIVPTAPRPSTSETAAAPAVL